jgi:hypothetical protein
LEIRYATEMRPGRTQGCWQFYEDSEHMKCWLTDGRKNRTGARSEGERL